MRNRKKLVNADGFTLIELLVAMAIFGIIGALAMGGLNVIITQQTIAKDQMIRLGELQNAVRFLTEDFAQLNPRYVRDVLGQGQEPPLVTDVAEENIVRLSRGGWRNSIGTPRGTLQRVQYRLEENVLIREYWPVMDYPLDLEPRARELIADVDEVRIEYLDSQSRWSEQWPPLSVQPGSVFVYPRAVRITLELADWGEITRVVDLIE